MSDGGQVILEEGALPATVKALQARGHRVKVANDGDFGGYQGERWQYLRDDGRVVIITIINGRVSDIADRSR